MMEEEKKIQARPPKFRVDAPIRKIQTVEYDGEVPFIFQHNFTRLDSSNFKLLLQHENDTLRVSERVAPGATRAKNRSLPADGNLYKALITGGGWRPGRLDEVRDEALIQEAAREIYSFDETTQTWKPGFFNLLKEDMVDFVVERQSTAIFNLQRANGEYIASPSGGISFMYEKAGVMKICLNIGDPESPAYKILASMRRPDSKRRNQFRENFAYNVSHEGKKGKKGDLGHSEMKVDLEQGVSIFREYFISVEDDPEYSQVVFGEELNAEVPSGVRPYKEEDKDVFLELFDPNYMCEMAAAMVTSFSKTDLELPKR